MSIQFLRQTDLPKSNFSHELIGEEFGGIPACVIFVDAGPGRGRATCRSVRSTSTSVPASSRTGLKERS